MKRGWGPKMAASKPALPINSKASVESSFVVFGRWLHVIVIPSFGREGYERQEGEEGTVHRIDRWVRNRRHKTSAYRKQQSCTEPWPGAATIIAAADDDDGAGFAVLVGGPS
jgi:hypothetical protein